MHTLEPYNIIFYQRLFVNGLLSHVRPSHRELVTAIVWIVRRSRLLRPEMGRLLGREIYYGGRILYLDHFGSNNDPSYVRPL